MPYTEDQKAVAKALLAKPMTAEQLATATGMAKAELEQALSGMEEKGFVRKAVPAKGGEPKYALVSFVAQGVKRRMAAKGEKRFRVKMLIEGLSESEEGLKKHMDLLESRLRKEPYDVPAFKRSDATNFEKNYTAFFDMEMAVPSLRDVTYLIVNYGPSYIELLEPKRVELSLADTQEVLNEMLNAVHYYIGIIAELKREQIRQASKTG